MIFYTPTWLFDSIIILTNGIYRLKQLNQEAIALDWTKSAGHTLNGSRFIEDDDSPMDVGGVSSGHKLGGISLPSSNIRSTAAQAAIMRYETVCVKAVDF